MISETEHDYHLRRARTELGLADRSKCQAASESHRRLSSLHMQLVSRLESRLRPPSATSDRKVLV